MPPWNTPPDYIPGNPGAPVPTPISQRSPFWAGSQGPVSYLQSAAPTNIPPGTLWVDTGTGNTWRWNGLSFDNTNIGRGIGNPMTSAGDTIYLNAALQVTALHAGSNGQVLQLSGGLPSWQTLAITSFSQNTGKLLGRSTAGAGAVQEITPNATNLTLSGLVLNTVQDIATTSAPTFLGVTATRIDGSYQYTLNNASRSYGLAVVGTTFQLDDRSAGLTRWAVDSSGNAYLGAPYQAATGVLTNTVTTGAIATIPKGSNGQFFGVSAGVLGFFTPAAGTISSIQGTSSQVLVNGTSGSPQTGVITLTSPQNIGTADSPVFGGLTVSATAGPFLIVKTGSTTGVPQLQATNDQNAELLVGTNGSAVAGTTAGLSNAALAFVYTGSAGATLPTALLLGTSNSKPVVFAVNGSEVGRWNITGNFVVTNHLTVEGVTSTGATGSGRFVFDGSPALVTPNLGTPSAGVLTNTTGLPLTSGVTGVLPIANGGTNAATAVLARVALNKGSTALTDAATVATDASTGNVFTVTLGGNRTLGAPSNLASGATYIWKFTQDGTGSRTLAYNAVFKFPGGTAPTLTTTAGAVDILSGVSDGTNVYCGSMLSDVK